MTAVGPMDHSCPLVDMHRMYFSILWYFICYGWCSVLICECKTVPAPFVNDESSWYFW
jgi:hypothetical protein